MKTQNLANLIVYNLSEIPNMDLVLELEACLGSSEQEQNLITCLQTAVEKHIELRSEVNAH